MTQSPLSQSPSISSSTPTPVTHPFSFTGSTAEYFQIWIVNVALTILTLGIYGAWAKVRREQYFHSHTFLDGHSFEYTANPISILKGRALLFAFVFLFVLSNAIFPLISLVFIAVGVVAFPWVITQALKFRARYTNYRNISFAFTGSYGRSFKYFIGTRIVAALSMGTLLPWAKHRERKYVVTGLRYGTTPFEFGAKIWDFYRLYLGVFVFVILPFLIIGGFLVIKTVMSLIESGAFKEGGESQEALTAFLSTLMANGGWIALAVGFLLIVSLQIVVPMILKIGIAKATWNNSSIASHSVVYVISLLKYIWIVVSNLILRLVTLGLAAPFCVVRLHRYRVECLSLYGYGALGGFAAGATPDLRAFGDEVSDMYDLDIDLGF